MSGNDGGTEGRNGTNEVAFHYIKSNYFRVVHADGVWGGLTPRGLIQASIFSERSPIPKRLVHELTDAGKLGKEKRELRSTRDGIVREVEVEIVWDLDAAKSFLDWMTTKVEMLEERVKKQKDKPGGGKE